MAGERGPGDQLASGLPDAHPWGPEDPCRDMALEQHAALIGAITERYGASVVNQPFGEGWARNQQPSIQPGGAYYIGDALYPNGDRVPYSVPILDQGHVIYPRTADGLNMLRATMQRIQGDVDPRDLLTYACDSAYGRLMADFTARGGMHRYIPAEDRAALLQALEGELTRITNDVLREHPSLRALAQRDPRVAAAGHRPEPWRVVALLGDGTPLSDEEAAMLRKLAEHGPGAGIHLLLWNIPLSEAPARTTVVGQDVYVEAGAAPSPDEVAALSREIATSFNKPRASPEYKNFSPAELWQEQAMEGVVVQVAVGANGEIIEGKFDNQTPHWMIIGPTGSGKSTIFKNTVIQIGERYGPDEANIYYLDLKDNVDAATLVRNAQDPHFLPHIRTVAYNSVDHEFPVSVLQDLIAEKQRRAEAFKQAGVSNISDYRGPSGGRPMPRIIIAIDEFHKLLTGPLAEQALPLMEELARDGRYAGIHFMLGSQSLPESRDVGGSPRLDPFYEQFTMRVALPQAKSVLAMSNHAADELPRFSAVFNNASGAQSGNAAGQFPDVSTATVYAAKRRLASERDTDSMPEPHVYDGHHKPKLAEDPTFTNLAPSKILPARAIIGQRINTTGDAAVAAFTRAPRSNAAIYGRTPEVNCNIIDTMVESLSRQHIPGTDSQATFRIVCASQNNTYATRADALAQRLRRAGLNVSDYGQDTVNDALNDAEETIGAARAGAKTKEYVIVYGLDEAAGVIDGAKLGQVLERGSPLGTHVIFSCNTPRDLGSAIGGLFVDITKYSDMWVAAGVSGTELRPLFENMWSAPEWSGQPDRVLFYDKLLGGEQPTAQKLRAYQS
jgi:S-DNA-T family DNA segregation ATPase FtsK/SpoIIIE